ncbi:MAG: NAD(+)/NADH kinase [Desulfovibrio sp.]|jgi:Predicted sugar kinase
MRTSIKQILIVYKKDNGKAHGLGNEIFDWLKEHALDCFLACSGQNYKDFFQNPGIVLVLGGDGTILEVARYFTGTGTIILGINFGRVGFLASAEPDNWKEILKKALERPEDARKCLALEWQLHGKNCSQKGFAINDLVVSHGKVARLVNLELNIDDNNLGCLRSDGVIFFSPLGSSGYNYSAGGPIIHPASVVLGMTPVCPFMSSSASLVFPAKTTFSVKLEKNSPDCYLTVDGQENWQLQYGDVLYVRGQTNAVRLWGNDQKYISHLAKF